MTTIAEQLFTQARTAGGYLDRPVSDQTLRDLYDLLKWGPTAANACPARFVFVRSEEGRQRLVECVSPGNVAKVRQAPVTVVVGMDLAFYEHLPQLYPQADARSWFVGRPEAYLEAEARRNSSLQGGYLIIAARLLGLDCGPMGGFDGQRMDAAFWAGTTVRTNFICTLGHGDPAQLRPRNPRLAFEDACRFA